MMAQPQQPQQPIFRQELDFTLDKLFTKVTTYVSARVEELSTQLRVYNQESISRDQDLANAILSLSKQVSALTQQQTTLAQQQTTLAQQQATLTQEFNEMKATQQVILQLIHETQAQMREAHAEAMEAINQLKRKDKE